MGSIGTDQRKEWGGFFKLLCIYAMKFYHLLKNTWYITRHQQLGRVRVSLIPVAWAF
jgi:hypothetical protein